MLSNKKILGGVCKKIGTYLGINITLVRFVWVLLTIITFIIPGIIVYFVLWFTDQPKMEERKN